MKQNRLLLLLAFVAVLALGVAACGSSDDSPDAASAPITTDQGSAESSGGTETLKVGYVPSIDLGVLKIGEEQGFFEEEGLTLETSPVDSGPNIITGLTSGQFDIGWVAYAPPVLAVGEGDAPLRVVTNSSNQGPAGTNGGVLVRKDSGIKSWKDLAGKKIGTNAPRSLFSLTVPAAIKKDGGDPSGIELVPLPFTAMGKAVESGDVAAGVVLEPFGSAALKQYPDLEDLGDSSAEVFEEGTPTAVYVTSTKTGEEKADQIEAFKRGYDKSVDYAKQHEDEVKVAGGELAGLPPAAAKQLPLAPISNEVTAAQLKPLGDMMVEFGWLKKAPDLQAFVGQ